MDGRQILLGDIVHECCSFLAQPLVGLLATGPRSKDSLFQRLGSSCLDSASNLVISQPAWSVALKCHPVNASRLLVDGWFPLDGQLERIESFDRVPYNLMEADMDRKRAGVGISTKAMGSSRGKADRTSTGAFK